MKYQYTISIAFCLACLFSCIEEPTFNEKNITEGINIQIGTELIFTSEDIDYYDNSSHLFYLKRNIQTEARSVKCSKCWILNNNEVIYEGGYNSCGMRYSKCSSLFFDNYENANFTLELGKLWCAEPLDTLRTDPRNNDGFLAALKQNDIYREGLTCQIDSLVMSTDTSLVLHYTITNNEGNDYYFFNKKKIENPHFFDMKNQLELFDFKNNLLHWSRIKSNNGSYTFSQWQHEWGQALELIESGKSRSYSDVYTFKKPIEKETYWMKLTMENLRSKFENPEDRWYNNTRIWLGIHDVWEKVKIQ